MKMEDINDNYSETTVNNLFLMHTRIQRGDMGPDPLKNHQNIGFRSNTDSDPHVNHKATKQAFKIWPPFMVVF